MNEDMIADLKQFIAATVTQAIAPFRQEVNERFEQIDQRFEQIDQRFEQIDQRFDGIEQRLDALTADVAEIKIKVPTIADAHAVDLADHDRRIKKLELQVGL